MTAQTAEPGSVVLQAAMGTEFRALCGILEPPVRELEMSGRLVRSGHLGGLPVIVVKGGWGKVMAASSCQAALDLFQPDLVVDCGTAGALREDLRVGDVFVARSVRDGAMQTEWAARLDAPSGLDSLLALCRPAVRWHDGTVLTLEQTVNSRPVRESWAERGFDVVSWEPFGLIKTAAVNSVSALSLRVVSDLADENVVETFHAHRSMFLERLGQAAMELLEGWVQWDGARRDAIVWQHPAREKQA